MIDLHCHLLPGIDDGPATHAETLKMCRLAAVDGITHAITTPHIHPGRYSNMRESIAEEARKLQRALNKRGIPLKIGYAAEVRLTDHLMQQVESGEIPFYGEVDGYQVMLLEFPHGHIVPGSEKLVRWLLERKIRPLIAHPERNKQVMKDPSRIEPFLGAGCWLQVTAGSLLDCFGERAKLIAEELLEKNLVTVLASDGHNIGARKPLLADTFDYVGERFGEERARQLLLHNPARIANSQFGLKELI